MSKLAVSLIIGASLASSVGSTIGSASSGLGKLKTQTDQLKLGQSIGQEYQAIEKEIGKVGEEFGKTGYKSAELGRKLVSLERSKYKAGEEARKYGLNVKDLSKDMAALGTAAKLAEGQVGRMEARMARAAQRSQLRGQLLGMTAAATALLGYPLKAAIPFEAQMSRVGAITKASAIDQTALMESAREQGRKTQFTASQAAAAQEYLGMAGYKTNEIISALPGNLSLAAAGQLDLARTADISSNILSGFSLKAAEADRVADVLAETATSTNTNIEQMGDAMKYAAPIAQTLGVTLEETSAMVGMMANAGLQGSLGGTALRSALTRMSSNKQALDHLKELGVKTRDLKGNMLPVPAIMKNIAEKTKNMGTAERAAAYSMIFGREAVSGMAKVIEAAADGSLDSMVDKLNNCEGAANEMAKRMNDNAKGALLRLGSAAESVAIDIGNSLLPSLADGAEKLAVFFGKVSEFAGKHPQLVKALTLSTAGFLGLKAATIVGRIGFSHLADGASIANGAFQMLRPSTIQAGIHLMKMRGAGSLVGGVFKTLGNGISSFAVGAIRDFKAISAGFKALGAAAAANPVGLILLGIAVAISVVWYYWESIKKAFLTFAPKLKAAWSNIGEAIKKPFVAAFDWIGAKIEWFSQKWDALKSKLGLGGKNATVGSTAASFEPAKTRRSVAGPRARHETGGIFNKPHLAAFAEGGKEEAVINISDNDSRARSIWHETGRRMGMASGAGSGANINISVYGSPGMSPTDIAMEVRRVLADEMRKAQSRARGRFADAAVFG